MQLGLNGKNNTGSYEYQDLFQESAGMCSHLSGAPLRIETPQLATTVTWIGPCRISEFLEFHMRHLYPDSKEEIVYVN
jgi:hypothetical protein